MQLAEFILKNIEPIAQEWEEFARTCTPGAIGMSKGALLDDITQILDAVVDDMEQPHTPAQQATKGKSQRSSDSLIVVPVPIALIALSGSLSVPATATSRDANHRSSKDRPCSSHADSLV
jgi:hypothetical protein